MQRNEAKLISGVVGADDYKQVPDEISPEQEIAMLNARAVERHRAAPKLGKASKGKRRFRSENPKFRLQMATTKPRLSPEGYWIEGESRFIQFRPYSQGGGYFETQDLDEIQVIENCSTYGVDIYDMDAMEVEAREARLEAVERMVASDSRLLERLRAKFGATDFIEKKGFNPKEGKG